MINDIIGKIKKPDEKINKLISQRTASLAMPYRAMGEITDLSERLSYISGTLTPKVDKRAIIVMAGDHGVHEEGVAIHPQSVTEKMLSMIVQERSAVCVYAKHTNTLCIVADMGIVGDVDSKIAKCDYYINKIGRGTANFTKQAAMTRTQAEQSICTGYRIASESIEKYQLNLLIAGEMGIANTTPSTAIASVYTGLDAEQLAGAGAGLDRDGVKRKINAVYRGLKRHKPIKEDPIGVLASIGGFEIGAMAGVYLAAAAHGIPVLLDGIISSAAALLAHSLAPVSLEYMIAGHESGDKGHQYVLNYLGLKPLLRLGMRLGEGTGAVCAVPLLDLAVATITEIATLEEAGIKINN